MSHTRSARSFALSCVGLSLAAIAVPSCVHYKTPSTPWIGGTFMDIEAPVDVNPTSIAPNARIGKSSSKSIGLFVVQLFAWGDASVNAAARKGGITRIDHVDHRFFNVFGCFQSYETIVSGE